MFSRLVFLRNHSKSNRISSKFNNFVFDLETTGFSCVGNNIIEICCLVLDSKGGVFGEKFHYLVKPSHRIPSFITKLTGIINEMISGAYDFLVVGDKFCAFVNGILNDFAQQGAAGVLVVHNGPKFDVPFLLKKFEQHNLLFPN